LYEAGLVPDERAVALVEHASSCDACGALLADMHPEPADETATLLLRSATAEWKKDMLRQIAVQTGQGAETGAASRSRYYWMAAAAAVVAMVGGSVWWVHRNNSPEAAFRLLAQSYTEQRPFEMRIPGALYAGVRVQRGAESLNDRDLASLASADALITSRLAADPDNPAWLQAGARSDLLKSNYKRALEELARAQEHAGDMPDILGDFGLAHLERAETGNGQSDDIGKAIDYLSKAIVARPQEPVYRFNRALAFELSHAPNRAIEDWEAYLRLDPSGGWAEEARKHKEAQKELLRKQSDRGRRPARSDEAILSMARQGFGASPPGTKTDPDAIARDLATRHHDPWLSDLRAANNSAASREASRVVAQASSLTASGDISAAAVLWPKAKSGFRQGNNPAGFLFSAVEEVYIFERLSRPDECLGAASAILPQIQRPGYRWLEAQLEFFVAGCLAEKGRFEAEYATALAAQQLAEQSDYQTLVLQALGVRSSALRQIGSYRQAMKVDSDGLSRYWEAPGDLTRAYQFYYGLATSASALSEFHVAAAWMNEAVGLASMMPNRPVEAMVRGRYAETLMQDGREGEAEKEFQLSAGIFKKLSDSPSMRLYAARADLSRARLADESNDVAGGLERVGRMQSISFATNSVLEAQVWYLKAQLLARAGRSRESEGALRKVLILGSAARGAASRTGESSALAQQVSQALGALTDRLLDRDAVSEALDLWTEYNPCCKALPPETHTTLLVFADLPRGPVVWVRNARGLTVRKVLASREEVSRNSAALRRLLADPKSPGETIRALGKGLYAKLIQPTEDLLAGSDTLYISTSQLFDSLAFGTLVTPSGHWLADNYRITYFPPLPGGISSHQGAITPNARLLAVGVDSPAELLHMSLPRLPGVERDLQAAARAFPSHQVMFEAAGTEKNLISNLPQADVFHFSGHVIVNPGDSALVLAADPHQQAGERALWISRLPREILRNCKLAVLAACSTGRSSDGDGDPSSGMARNLLLAGVPEVVASRWDVDSSATSALIEAFYAALGKGLPARQALYSAVSSIRRRGEYSHPYYWAAFEDFHI
jgi:CHAT domain-containing protein